MITLYTSLGRASCGKAKQWLKDNDMKYIEKNIFTTLLKEDEIKYLSQRTENDTEDIIPTRSKAFQELHRDLDDISIKGLVGIIQRNPSILKRLIMISEKSSVVGYNDDEITALVPAKLRLTVQQACNPSCVNYPICGRVREEVQELYKMEATKRAVTDCLQASCHSFLSPSIAFYFVNGDGKAPIEQRNSCE